MRSETRDYGRRADCLRRMVKRLLAARRGVRAADLADDHLSFEGVQRILSRFVFKGLVRRDRNRWVATPILTGCPLVPVKQLP